MVCLHQIDEYGKPENPADGTHRSFHVALPNSALVVKPSTQHELVAYCTFTYLAVAFPSLPMITFPKTTPVLSDTLSFRNVPELGCDGEVVCKSFSTPPSPKSSPVHGSMYAREGGCRNANEASKNYSFSFRFDKRVRRVRGTVHIECWNKMR